MPSRLTGVVAIAAGSFHNLALKSNGTVVAWGENTFAQSTVPTGLTGVVAIAGGYRQSLALKSDGTAVAWGQIYSGPRSWSLFTNAFVPDGLTGVVAIAAGNGHSLGLRADGTVVAWGYNENGQCTVPGGLTGVMRIAAGGYHSLALKRDGTVVAWGDVLSMRDWDMTIGFSPATVPSGLSNVVAIATGHSHSLALRSDGAVVAWGPLFIGSAWTGTDIASVNSTEILPSGLTGVIAITAGGAQSLALVASKPVLSAGRFLPDQALELAMTGEPWQTCEIQATTNFAEWTTVTNLVATNVTSTLTVPALPNGPRRFYRVIIP
jgi:alpha-tubulin suppressor-like RCC1 family protein